MNLCLKPYSPFVKHNPMQSFFHKIHSSRLFKRCVCMCVVCVCVCLHHSHPHAGAVFHNTHTHTHTHTQAHTHLHAHSNTRASRAGLRTHTHTQCSWCFRLHVLVIFLHMALIFFEPVATSNRGESGAGGRDGVGDYTPGRVVRTQYNHSTHTHIHTRIRHSTHVCNTQHM